jgi:hypothetical protein
VSARTERGTWIGVVRSVFLLLLEDAHEAVFGIVAGIQIHKLYILVQVLHRKASPGPDDLSHLEKDSLFPRIRDQYDVWTCNSLPPYRLSLPEWIWATDD